MTTLATDAGVRPAIAAALAEASAELDAAVVYITRASHSLAPEPEGDYAVILNGLEAVWEGLSALKAAFRN